jgi:hypothetical protein
MSQDPTARSVELHALLASLPEVQRFSTADDDEGATLAHALTDIAESGARIANVLLPQLTSASDPAQAVEVLSEIGEEVRHILYHVRDSKFFAYLLEHS